jgi:D-alanyl-lipoteichoic acid acyltransferase DltB (MBOAT superfamily)
MADRLGVYVDTVYSCYELHSGLTCLVASIFYSLQIYGDFAGYSLMAIGVGRMLGFNLINNFNRPYFSASITEFWRRWHISLSLWLKDYVYIPLGGSRCSKLKCYRNIFLTFLVSGIWHGANWTFILWGILHGAFQIMEKALNMQKDDCKGIVRAVRILFTFMLVNFAWIFFRMPDIHSGLDVCRKIFTDIGGSFFVNAQSIVLGLFAASIVFVKECFEESGSSFTLFNNRHTVVRWLSYTITVILILLLGVFDSTQFIYVNF